MEDQLIVAMDLAANLERDGYNVTGMADNAEEAIELFRRHHIDIVLMDIKNIGDKTGLKPPMKFWQSGQFGLFISLHLLIQLLLSG